MSGLGIEPSPLAAIHDQTYTIIIIITIITITIITITIIITIILILYAYIDTNHVVCPCFLLMLQFLRDLQ